MEVDVDRARSAGRPGSRARSAGAAFGGARKQIVGPRRREGLRHAPTDAIAISPSSTVDDNLMSAHRREARSAYGLAWSPVKWPYHQAAGLSYDGFEHAGNAGNVQRPRRGRVHMAFAMVYRSGHLTGSMPFL